MRKQAIRAMCSWLLLLILILAGCAGQAPPSPSDPSAWPALGAAQNEAVPPGGQDAAGSDNLTSSDPSAQSATAAPDQTEKNTTDVPTASSSTSSKPTTDDASPAPTTQPPSATPGTSAPTTTQPPSATPKPSAPTMTPPPSATPTIAPTEDPYPLSCTFLIDCNNAVKAGVVSKRTILASQTVKFAEGESVFTVMKRLLKEKGISMRSKGSGSSAYVSSINGLSELDGGRWSGWMYNVNGWYPNYSCGAYKLKEGDKVEWRYTCDLGKDLGQSFDGDDITDDDDGGDSDGGDVIMPED